MSGKFYSIDDYLPKESKSLEVKTEDKVEIKTGGETPGIAALKARATELGVTYADNIGAKKLAERIAEKEKELADASGDAD